MKRSRRQVRKHRRENLDKKSLGRLAFNVPHPRRPLANIATRANVIANSNSSLQQAPPIPGRPPVVPETSLSSQPIRSELPTPQPMRWQLPNPQPITWNRPPITSPLVIQQPMTSLSAVANQMLSGLRLSQDYFCLNQILPPAYGNPTSLLAYASLHGFHW